jgi:acyl-CoA synthetase (AMP-forming)/AMP-acid ligase II
VNTDNPTHVPANISHHLVEMARRQPDTTAIVCPWARRGGSLTYRQLDDRSTALAAGLVRSGVGPGVRVALMVRPGLDLFSLAFALFKAGAVPVLVDPGIGLKNMKACLKRARPEAFVGLWQAHVARILLGWGRESIRKLVTVGPRLGWGGLSLGELEAVGRTAGESPRTVDDPEARAAIVFTSGSTGPPKGVVYRHGNFAAQVEAIRETYGIRPGEVNLPTFPLFALFDPALGMTSVIPDMDPTRPARVHPPNVIGPVNDFAVTTMFGSPALLDTVGRWGEERGSRMPTIRRVISAGAPVSPRIMERFAKMLVPEAQIYTPYGATESLPVASIGSHDLLGEPRQRSERGEGTCVGRPVRSIEAAVIRTTDRAVNSWSEAEVLPPGEVGEIVVRGLQVTREYFDAPDHTRLGKIGDGGTVRHRMGDLGYFDSDGRLWFCGRKAHRVETGAGTLHSVRCEGVTNAHAMVKRSALVGVRVDGAVTPVMCIEAESDVGRSGRPGLTEELRELCRAHEVTQSVDTFLFHPSFPVDIRHNAKINRAELSRWAARALGGEPAIMGS